MDIKYLPCCMDYDDMKFRTLILEAKKLQKFLKSLQYLETKSNNGHLFECPECGFATSHGKGFVKHFRIHLPVKLHSVDGEFDANLEESFLLHRAVSERAKKTKEIAKGDVIQVNDEGYLFRCSVCSYKTNRKWNLAQHNLLHEQTKDTFACHLCIYKTNFKRRLKLHLQDHAEGRRFQCPNCDYKTLRKGSLHQHMHIHSQEKRYECPTCSYRTNRKWSLKKHFKIHAEKRMLSNLTCDIGTKELKTLKQHRKVHHRTNAVTRDLDIKNSRVQPEISLFKNTEHMLFSAETNIELKELDITWITNDVQTLENFQS